MEAHNSQRVLLVDDEPALLVLLRRTVQRVRPDAIVVYASSVEMAEWQLRSTTVRLVFTDMRMGDDESGLRVLEVARELGVRAAVVTGCDDAFLNGRIADDVPVVRKQNMTSAQLRAIVEKAFVS